MAFEAFLAKNRFRHAEEALSIANELERQEYMYVNELSNAPKLEDINLENARELRRIIARKSRQAASIVDKAYGLEMFGHDYSKPKYRPFGYKMTFYKAKKENINLKTEKIRYSGTNFY